MDPINGELNVKQLFGAIGKPFSNSLFDINKCKPASKEDKERHYYYKLNLTVKNPKEYKLLGIEIEEIHIFTDSSNVILSIIVVINNENVIDKLTAAIGEYKIAGSISPEENAPYSFYSWDYNGLGLDVKLNAYQFQFIPTLLRDSATLVFNNGNLFSYADIPK